MDHGATTAERTTRDATSTRALVVLTVIVLVSAFLRAPAAGAQGGDGPRGTVAGTVTDDAGTPLAGIVVSLHGSCDDGGFCEFARETTEADGRYRIAPIVGEVAQVAFRDPLLRYAYVVRTDLGEVGRDEQVNGFDAVLPPSSSVSGLVRFEGAGFPGANVMVQVSGAGQIPVTTVSSAGGVFTLAGLPAGVHSVVATVGAVATEPATTPAVSPGRPAQGIVLSLDGLSTVSGVVTDQTTGLPLNDVGINGARTDAAGRYTAYVGVSGEASEVSLRVDPGRYFLTPIGGSRVTISPGDDIADHDIALVPRAALAPPPAGTIVAGVGTAPGGVPSLRPSQALQITSAGCPGGQARFSVHDLTPTPDDSSPHPVLDQPMPETPVGSGNYVATAGVLNVSGEFTVDITIDCPGPADESIGFGLYIDPSGTVVDTTGAPIAGARVTLLRAESAAGPFTPVPNGSVLMSPTNRTNPDLTGSDGAFAWFTATGVYRVRAERLGCHAPGDPATAAVETPSLPVPPEWTGLVLTLQCAAPAGRAPVPPLGYTPLSPARLLDTRPGEPTIDTQAAGTGPLTPGTPITLQITGRGGVPTTGVAAVALNLTATQSTTPSYITAWPTNEPRPTASNLNTDPGQDTPNLVITKLDPNGQINLYNNAGTTHLIADIVGWYPTGPAYTPLSPARLLDTRPGEPTIDTQAAGTGPLTPGTPITLQITGRGGVPTTGVAAVALNLTATQSTTPSYITAWPTNEPRPTASNLNTDPGQDTPNLVITKLDPNGQINLYNNAGTTHLIADIVGWYPTGPAYTPLSPARLLDTRPGEPTIDTQAAGTGPLTPGTPITLQITGRGSVPTTGVAAVALNLTATQSTTPSYITAWPTNEPRPTASNLNTDPGQDTPNLVITKLDPNGQINLYNNAGTTHLIADIVGWYPT